MEMKHERGVRGQGKRMRVFVGVGLVMCAVIASLAAGLSLLANHPTQAHAAGIGAAPTADHPWGMTFDSTGNLWVAEPNCDGNPFCGAGGTPPAGMIGEYTYSSTLTLVKNFTPPATVSYNPMFVAIDKSGNVWFTDPTHAAIGELIPSTNTWSEWILTDPKGSNIAGAIPVDLTIDKNGNIWFTDFGTSAIGEFNTTTDMATETAVPTAKTSPYGIAIASDGVTVWFTENSATAVGSFTAPASSALTTAAITEHTFTPPAGTVGTTPHLITVDKNGNAWFSEGFSGQIGEVAGTTAAATVTNYCVSNTVNNPHISGIGVDNTTGKVWFDDSINARVGYLTPAQYQNDCATPGSSAGVTYTFFTGSAHTHDGLIVDASGNAFIGQEFSNLISYIPAGAALPPPIVSYPPGPTAKTWYFAEGRVGAGFQEFLTIGNPDPANQCIVDITYLLEQGNPVTVKQIIGPASRWTESVNNDLGTPVTSTTGKSVATMIQNDPASSCVGVVAERPMYFNFHGDQSGTDVLGATTTSSSYYFADVPNGAGFASFITILNPPTGTASTVTVNYYAGGKLVGSQNTVVLPGQRGTLSPGSLSGLPTHMAAIVTSTQPVVVERPTYFAGINGGFAGIVTGAASVIGSQAVQHEYYFAEGYAGQNGSGGKTQENLVISNLDSVVQGTANVTISLEYINGTKNNFTVSVPYNSQVIWDVNANGVGAASNEVSADVVSTGAGVVVSRQLYFSYAHTLSRGRLTATGGTEVTGLPAPMIGYAYSFAEGYSNNGYNEWLTLQNPTTASESIVITMVNGYGRVYSMTLNVGANTRATLDVTATIIQNLLQPGDDHRGYEVSMTVQTLNHSLFVVERPMYWNTNGYSPSPTVGGSDVIGY